MYNNEINKNIKKKIKTTTQTWVFQHPHSPSDENTPTYSYQHTTCKSRWALNRAGQPLQITSLQNLMIELLFPYASSATWKEEVRNCLRSMFVKHHIMFFAGSIHKPLCILDIIIFFSWNVYTKLKRNVIGYFYLQIDNNNQYRRPSNSYTVGFRKKSL